MSAQRDSETPERGRAAVEERLITATAELLAETGPNQLSIRTVSERARVNSGQVYHYFGSKDALLRAGMRRLAENHYEHMRGKVQRGVAAMSMREDERYWRALGHVVLDGADDLFRIEINEEISAPRDHIDAVRAEAGGTLDAAQTAEVLSTIALALGWAVFEPFLLALNEQDAGHPTPEELRNAVDKMWAARIAASP